MELAVVDAGEAEVDLGEERGQPLEVVLGPFLEGVVQREAL